jgi:transcriptional regulator with XRE-family HTH domain
VDFLDISLVIRNRLNELGLEQKDLAAAAQVTESYISQVLAGKKAPPAPGRTGIYEKIGRVLRLPSGQLSNLAYLQRRDQLRERVAEPPQPLFKDCRELVLGKCNFARRKELRRIFEKEPFGELERLLTQKILDAVQGVVREQSKNEEWLRMAAQLSHRSVEEIRAAIPGFLETDVFNISRIHCGSFLDPILDSWDINLKTFGMEVVLNSGIAPGGLKRYEFAEQTSGEPLAGEPGLELFFNDKLLSGDVTVEEIEFLKALRFRGRRPSAIYYYRELQNLRDPLHFLPSAAPVPRQAATRNPELPA